MSDLKKLAGKMIAIEGIDQAGKATIANHLATRIGAAGVKVTLIGFPDYDTEIGMEIAKALAGNRDYPREMLQLLMAANRWEWQVDIKALLEKGHAIVCDRYIGSGIAYGIAQGLEQQWVQSVEKGLLEADLTILLDIDPGTSKERKRHQRDTYEENPELLKKARAVYLKLAELSPTWRTIDARAPVDMVRERVIAALYGWM